MVHLINKSFDYRRGYRDGILNKQPARQASAQYVNGFGVGSLKRVRQEEKFAELFVEHRKRILVEG